MPSWPENGQDGIPRPNRVLDQHAETAHVASERRRDNLAKIFWDTNLFIYLFEEHPAFAPRVSQLRQAMLTRGYQLLTSALTAGEILAGPSLRGDSEIAQQYMRFFQSPGLRIVPFDLKAASLYARIRQDRAIQRPDAIQLACAAAAEVNLFITNDARLSQKVVPGIDFISSLERSPL